MRKIRLNYIPLPQEIVDKHLDISLNEFRLLMYLTRHQFRLGVSRVKLSYDDLMNGRKLPNGKRVDKGCGISNGRDLRIARDKLENLEYLELGLADDGTHLYSVTYLAMDDQDEEVQEEGGLPKWQQDSVQNEPNTVAKMNTPNTIKEIEGQYKVSIPSNTILFSREKVVLLKDSLGLQEKPNYEFQANQIYAAYPRKVGRAAAIKAIIRRLKEGIPYERLLERVYVFARSPAGQAGQYTPHAVTWFNQERYNDDEKEWHKNGKTRDQQRNSNNRESFTATAESHGLTKLGGGIPALQQRVLPRVSRDVANDHDSEERESESDSVEFPEILSD